ncbi:MAG: TIGR02206 family membrane protein [Porticoccaceae bacterium]|nr:TIGR02206 family membrane protein [Porticoccaceae bacterium]
MDHLFFSFDIPFESFSADHWWALATFFIFLSVIISISRKLSSARNLWLGRVISIFLSVTVLIFSWIHWRNGLFNYRVDLPLSICNLFALLAPLLFWQPHFKRFEVIYFLVICGTFQAMLTPDLYAGFPSYGYFKYWIVHGGLVILVIHHLLAFRLIPSAMGMVRTFGWLNVYLVLLIPLNLWLGSNYFYLMNKPINPSILDYFGPWPFYILICEIVAMGFFAIAYVPIIIGKKYINKTAKMASAI